eukprot:7864613-Pyramimonas_sp.AAC.1
MQSIESREQRNGQTGVVVVVVIRAWADGPPLDPSRPPLDTSRYLIVGVQSDLHQDPSEKAAAPPTTGHAKLNEYSRPQPMVWTHVGNISGLGQWAAPRDRPHANNGVHEDAGGVVR